MHTIYLDQNKWIALAQVAKNPLRNSDLRQILECIGKLVDSEEIRIPLTFTNIFETHKVNDPQRRSDLAKIQAVLSRGVVFKGRTQRLEVEISQFIIKTLQLHSDPLDKDWFLSKLFFESVAEWKNISKDVKLKKAFEKAIGRRPIEFLYDYLMETPNAVRLEAVQNYSEGSERLRLLVEDRREKHATETLAVRRRIYSALMMIDGIDLILEIAKKMGAHWKQISDIGNSNVRLLMNEVPTYFIEKEIAVRLESQTRPIEENDFRDMQAFCTVIPYADIVIGEKQFINLARQAKLDQKYGTRLETNILALNDVIGDIKC